MMLWPDQLKARIEIDRVWSQQEARSILLVSPTGSGKTVIGSDTAKTALAANMSVTFLAPRIELISQLCEKLDEWLPCGYGVITANRDTGGSDLYNKVQVASVDTLVSRAVKKGSMLVPQTDLLILDEAQLFTSQLRRALIDLFGPEVLLLGLTATPCTENGRGLGGIFERLVEVTTPKRLTNEGYLVPTRYLAPSTPDLKRVKLNSKGDYEEKGVEEAMAPLLGDIVGHWLSRAQDRHTVLFAPSIPHSLYLRNEFEKAGVSVDHIDSKMHPDMRRDVLQRFKRQETQVLCNVGILEYGVDIPSISCVDDCSPTKSLRKFLQRGGRGKRIYTGKRDLLYLDHAGNIHEHGFLEDDRHWDLEEGYRKPAPPRTRKKISPDHTPPRTLTCPDCLTVFSGSLNCTSCGYYFEPLAKKFHVVEGELVAFTTDDEDLIFARVQFYCELLQYAQERGKKVGWCAHTYKERYGKWPQPRWRDFTPLAVSPETLRYIRYRNIKRAKQREAEARRSHG